MLLPFTLYERMLQLESLMCAKNQERPISLMHSARHNLGALGKVSVPCPCIDTGFLGFPSTVLQL